MRGKGRKDEVGKDGERERGKGKEDEVGREGILSCKARGDCRNAGVGNLAEEELKG